MAVTSENYADILVSTQKDLGKMKWTDYASSMQEYVAFRKLFRKEQAKFDSGQSLQWNVQVAGSGNARMTTLYGRDNINVADTLKTASVPWRHSTSAMAYDEREMAMNRGANKIVSLMESKRVDMMIGIAELLEDEFWTKPATSADEEHLYGVFTFVTYNATEGFNGGNPTGFTSGYGGLNSTTYARHRNWSGQYTNVDKDDLITMWRKAATFTRWMPPTDIPQYGSSQRYGYYTNYNVLGPLERALEDQNDNLGNDVASKDGKVLFRSVPVTWVPRLEENDMVTDPIVGLDWSEIKIVFLTEAYMRETKPLRAPEQHNVWNIFWDCSLQVRCTNKRKQILLAKSNVAS